MTDQPTPGFWDELDAALFEVGPQPVNHDAGEFSFSEYQERHPDKSRTKCESDIALLVASGKIEQLSAEEKRVGPDNHPLHRVYRRIGKAAKK
jgi:hypothetical protein